MRPVRATTHDKLFGRGRDRPPSANPRVRLDAPASFGPDIAEPARILLVEDEPLYRRMVRMVVASPMLSVTDVETGEAAINLLSIRSFDLLLLDVSLPRLSGPETLTWIRQGQAHWRDMPVMALVAAADEGWVGPMRAHGLDDWTPKPIDRAHLMARILRLLPGVQDLGG